jgi:hypothetical protein
MDKGPREVATTIAFDHTLVKDRIKMIISDE